MRLMFLTNVAVAALAALCFQAGAQDSGPKLDKALPAAESVAPSSNEPRRVIQGGHHVTSTRGGVQTPSTATRQGMKGGRSATAGQGKVQTSAKVVKLNERQQAELRSEPVEKLDRVDFSLSTGTSVPSYAPIRPLPERIVEIVPQYRGYDFVMVRDEIVIIEPRTRQIVTVSPGEGRSAAYAPRGRLRLTSEQRQVIRRDLAPEGSAIHTQVQLGERVPADVSLLPMPAAVLSDVPIVGSLSLFRDGRGRRPRRAGHARGRRTHTEIGCERGHDQASARGGSTNCETCTSSRA